ncbi:hypothetical protein ACFWEK_17455, partial [Isoptericola sp. NPDC060257]
MSARELDAAQITDPALRAAYRTCRTLNARHGRTYFLATRLLPVERRPTARRTTPRPSLRRTSRPRSGLRGLSVV